MHRNCLNCIAFQCFSDFDLVWAQKLDALFIGCTKYLFFFLPLIKFNLYQESRSLTRTFDVSSEFYHLNPAIVLIQRSPISQFWSMLQSCHSHDSKVPTFSVLVNVAMQLISWVASAVWILFKLVWNLKWIWPVWSPAIAPVLLDLLVLYSYRGQHIEDSRIKTVLNCYDSIAESFNNYQ